VSYINLISQIQNKRLFSQRHIDDIKQLWIEFEKKTSNKAEDFEQTNHLVDQIVASLTKKHIQVKVKPSV
jgi:hypothetical protein